LTIEKIIYFNGVLGIQANRKEDLMKLRFANVFLVIGVSFLFFSVPAHAVSFTITDPQIIWQPDPGILPGDLSATIEFTTDSVPGSHNLAITVENTSGDLVPLDYPTIVSLTSLGFNLPGGVTIGDGEASLINWHESTNTTIGDNPNSLWGYNNTAEGPLADTPDILLTYCR
jgi:hypothetical protein